MDMQERAHKRILPIAIVAYMVYLKIAHSGLGMESIAKMEKHQFATLIGEALHCTNDATIYHYQRDYTMAIVMSFFSGFGLRPVGTENMVKMPCLFEFSS